MSEGGETRYDIRIIRRSFQMTPDDYHAIVTRRSDGKQLVFIAAWRWVLRLKVRRAALDRAFAASDRYEEKVADVREFRV